MFQFDRFTPGLNRVFRSLPGLLSALDIDLFRALGRVGQHDDLIGGDLDKAAEDDNALLAIALLDAHLAGRERRNERGMAWQNTERAITTGGDHHINIGL